jgi:aldehyde dehydrogenase (NAD+)
MAGTSISAILDRLGIAPLNSGICHTDWVLKPTGGELVSLNPATGEPLGRVALASAQDYEELMSRTTEVWQRWRMTPAPVRGQVVRDIGRELRRNKEDLGALVTLEMGKILAEGRGEVQEMIDMADFATGLSRQLYGLTMPSERPGHRMYEQWHPLGVIGVITAFNFPTAVWSWNALLAAVCGDCVVWKPSHHTPLTAIAVQNIANRVLARHNWQGVLTLAVGKSEQVGERMLADKRLPLISATGSCKLGRRVAHVVGQRLGRTLLELGGNNAVIVMKDADLELATRAILFGAIGTAGQRCTSIRRVLLDRAIAGEMTKRLVNAYRQVKIGDPMDPKTNMGPLVSTEAVTEMMQALEAIRQQGGEILYGGRGLGGCFVEPTLVRSPRDMAMLQEEVFAPILHLIEFDTLDEAIEIQNGVPQGLSSAIFTTNLMAAETFLSARGSDCGIANVNTGTSGAEIGGAFGGEKETGGGREAGSDAWKAYMRRQTVTINYSGSMPLAQGIEFGIGE